MTLSIRMRTLCSFLDTKEEGGLVDIGYDHGQLLHWASEQGIPNLYGVEKSKHFGQSYKQRYPHDVVEFYTGDGLHPLPKDLRPATLVLTGIGEEQIRRILDENTALWSHATYILFSPSSIDLCLRGFLNNNGWYMKEEVLLRERHKFYVLSLAVPGRERCSDEKQCSIGPRLFSSQDPLLDEYMGFLEKRFHGNQR